MSHTRPKVLIVDDLAEKLLVYRSILEDPGLDIVSAVSGEDALRRLLVDEFAVILLDVNMPGMDGFETASMIRKRKRCAHMPIIFLTAHSDELHSLKGYANGAVDYILTPVVPDVLRTKVSVFVELYRKAEQIREQSEALRELEAREHRRQLKETHERLDLALLAGNMVAFEWDGGDHLASWSDDFPQVFGIEAQAFSGALAAIAQVIHPEDRNRVIKSLRGVFDGGGELRIEHRVIRANAKTSWVELRARLFAQSSTEAARLVGVCMDISERKRTEQELEGHRVRLEELVLERTAELASSHERLRLADRLASIGTLAAGLGHDMGNLLLPIRLRLQTLEETDLSDGAREDLRAIAEACEYLKRLSHGLRLFALDPEKPEGSGKVLLVDQWWLEVSPFFRSTLTRGMDMKHSIARDLPPIQVPPHALTQAVYNVLQNACDATRDRTGATVEVAIRLSPTKRSVEIEVTDNGVGMDEDTRARCMEPFFTTKTRVISTGLGLALTCGCVARAGGTIEIDTALGVGTTFRLILPTVDVSPSESAVLAAPRKYACVKLSDARRAAYVKAMLESLGVHVVERSWTADQNPVLLVAGGVDGANREVAEFVSADESRVAIILDDAAPRMANRRIVHLPTSTSALDLRLALMSSVQA